MRGNIAICASKEARKARPKAVESVAWMTELKNTLSGAFFLSAALAYIRFDRQRTGPAYAASAACFVLALLSKSVTATLPGVLLVLAWWQHGRLEWRLRFQTFLAETRREGAEPQRLRFTGKRLASIDGTLREPPT